MIRGAGGQRSGGSTAWREASFVWLSDERALCSVVAVDGGEVTTVQSS